MFGEGGSPPSSGPKVRKGQMKEAGRRLLSGKSSRATKLGVGAATVLGGLALAGVAANQVVKRDLKRSSIDFDSIRQPPGGIPDKKTMAKYDTFKEGDVIRKVFKGRLGVRHHYAVYMGKDPKTGEHMLIDTGENWKTRSGTPFIRERGLTWDASPNDTEWEAVSEEEMDERISAGLGKKIPRDQVVHRARSLLGAELTYKGFESNCDSFAWMVATGDATGQQTRKVGKLTRFLSAAVTDTMLKVEVSSDSFPGGDLKKGTKIGPYVVTGRTSYAKSKVKMTTQEMGDFLARQRSIEVRRTLWEGVENPYSGERENRIAPRVTQQRSAHVKRVAPPPIQYDEMLDVMKDEMESLAMAKASRSQQSKKDGSEEDVRVLLGALGLEDPNTFEEKVEAIVSDVGGSSKNLRRQQMYKSYLMLALGMINQLHGGSFKKTSSTSLKQANKADSSGVIFELCRNIRSDAQGKVQKGKKCPGGYWIPRKHRCGGKKKASLGLRQSSQGGLSSSEEESVRGRKSKIPGGVATKAALGLTMGLAGAGGSAGYIVYKDFDKLGLKKEDVNLVSTPEEIAAASKEYDEFKTGDILVNTFQGVPGRYAQHYAVYGGKDEDGDHFVYEVVLSDKDKGPTFMKRKAHDQGRPRGKFKKLEETKPKAFSEEEILKRAESLVGARYEYETVSSNCENLARGIVYGDFSSSQGEKMSATTRVLSKIMAVPTNMMGGSKGRVPSSDIAKMMGPGGAGVYLGPKTEKKDSTEEESGGERLKTPEEFYRGLEELIGKTQPELRKVAEVSALKSYLSIAVSLKKNNREDLLPKLKENSDSSRPRSHSKRGKKKKRIRGKDGVVRTYWVSTKSGTPSLRSPGQDVLPRERTATRFAKETTFKIATGLTATAVIASGKRFVKEAEKAAITPEQKKNLRYTETGMPSEEDLARHDKDFQPGDLVRKSFKIGHKDFFHYGVYAGKDEKTGERMIYEVGAPGEGGVPSSKIAKSPLYTKSGTSPTTSLYERVPDEEMYVQGKDKARFSRDEILKRAQSMVGNEFDYAISKNNCESFARLVVEGQHYTLQGQTVAEDVKAAFDFASATVTRMAREKGITVITPEQAASYLEKFSQRKEGEEYPFSDFIAKERGDSRMDSSLIPLEEVIREFRKGKEGGGNLQRKAEEEIISRYFMLLSAMHSLGEPPRTDSTLLSRATKLGKLQMGGRLKC